MIQKLKLFFRRIFRKKEIYFTENDVIKKLIDQYSPKCKTCGNEINSVDNVYKLILKKNNLEFCCHECGEETEL